MRSSTVAYFIDMFKRFHLKGSPLPCFAVLAYIYKLFMFARNSFVRRKLSQYNLTAHVKYDKQAMGEGLVYHALWTEDVGKRDGNAIASALYKIINRAMDDIHKKTNRVV